jgi:YfiH family protein
MFPSPFFQFNSLQPISGLRHALTTRQGGYSEGDFATINLGYHVHDDAAVVTRNRRELALLLGYDAATLVAAQQVHGAVSHIATRDDSGRGALDWGSAIQGTDSLITAEPKLPLLILVADCAPLILVDARRRVLALVHAGWRGAVARVASQTVQRMEREFDTRLEDVWVGIGPHLCPVCFEIGDEVAAAAEPIAPDSIILGYTKPHLDLAAVLRADLASVGVRSEAIESMPHCPNCETDLFFSHRGQNGKAGRFGLVAWWE